jgi:hypothetical protein
MLKLGWDWGLSGHPVFKGDQLAEISANHKRLAHAVNNEDLGLPSDGCGLMHVKKGKKRMIKRAWGE